ncbi:hypothetical protein [Flavobacterium psychrophilum]|uniref:hypothetical protein n=1 Tax=Flavobacterium psychrophilum TaxID=96345 RepID=UPI000B7C3621|nr:hypothetical protein [Flavobacterium psychrophilum]MCB6089434.1 hypothetical protein [Flavobacterium psychrophilum]MCB6231687.1 hypothetical protein [Flavobacterium psychrophilum]SNA84760.1 hypothetical protein DK095_600081 [Flavobacterium psychrophilum]SNA88404.1 hypothetical protein FI146_850079 [Flavobacterium psychrophilum]
MNLDYKKFKEDCKYIIDPFLEKYGYFYDEKRSEDYINFYSNYKNFIEISMLDNFPHIGVSWSFFSNDLKYIKPNLIENKLNIDMEEDMNFYKEFKLKNDINSYSSQMWYIIAVLEKFYKPILIGEINLDEII